jgi:hypothetical protein
MPATGAARIDASALPTSQQSAGASSGLGVAGVALQLRLQRSARVSGSFVSGLVLIGRRLINPSRREEKQAEYQHAEHAPSWLQAHLEGPMVASNTKFSVVATQGTFLTFDD